VHLQADLRATVRWADDNEVPWDFSDRNAGGYLAQFFKDLENLKQVDWEAVAATNWRDATVKEGKQAEFLLHDSFPWELVETVGVMNQTVDWNIRKKMFSSDHIHTGWDVLNQKGWLPGS